MFIVFVPFLFSLSPSIRIRLKEQIQTNQNLYLKTFRVKIETFLNLGSDWPVMISISHNSKSKTSQFDFFFSFFSIFRMAGVTKKSPVAEIFDSMDYGPAPESQNEANKWLDNHKRKFGHFVNGKWYEPEGREYYTSKAPMNHSVLAETIQG